MTAYILSQPEGDLIITVLVYEKRFQHRDGWYGDDYGKKYYYENNEICTGLKNIHGKIYLFDENGVMQSGWQIADNKRYYFETDSESRLAPAYTGGIKKIGSYYYLFDKTGVMQKSGVKKASNGDKYYLMNSGRAYTKKWYKKSGKWYYFGKYGKMVSSIVLKIDSYYYLFDENGVMQKSGVKKDHNGNKYYLRKSGKAYTKKWYKKSGKWYYFGKYGEMVTSCHLKIGKKTYKFDKKGVCKNP